MDAQISDLGGIRYNVSNKQQKGVDKLGDEDSKIEEDVYRIIDPLEELPESKMLEF